MDIKDEVTPIMKSNSDHESEGLDGVPKVPGCLSCRQVLALLGFLGFLNVYCLRVNLSVALVAMVNNTATHPHISNECPVSNTTKHDKVGEFQWDQRMQGIILGSFFYGYILTQVPGGYLGLRYSGKKMFGFGVLCTSVLTLVTPIAAKTSVWLLIAVRVLEGIGEGVTFPAMHALWGKWAPPLERSRLAAFTYAGAQLGTVVSLPISGLLCDSDFLGGWPSVFYVFGLFGCLWFVLWMALVYETPSDHPRISTEERNYIERSIGNEKLMKDVPWCSIMTSTPVLAITLSHIANNWGFYTLLTCLPTYMKQILGFDLSENGFLSAIPYLMLWLVQITGGRTADFFIERKLLNTTSTRKLMNTLGMMLPAIFIVLTGYIGCNNVLAVLCLTLAVSTGGLNMSGFNINHLDIAPQYSGILMGITNMFATIPGFVGPLIVGELTNEQETRHQWQIVFYICAGVYVMGMTTFLFLGTGVQQPWANAVPQVVHHDNESESEDEVKVNSYVKYADDEEPLHTAVN